MEDLSVVALGCLLHDIGKVVQRADANPMLKSHPIFGADLLKSLGLLETDKGWNWVYESIKYHHWKQIKNGEATLPIAWFAFEADNLASAHDRKTAPELFDADDNRIDECEVVDKAKWDPKTRLNSVFSSFVSAEHGKSQEISFPLWFRRVNGDRYVRDPYPYPETQKSLRANTIEEYQLLRDQVLKPLLEFLKTRPPTSLETVNICLHYLEETFAMVPPDTFIGRTNDVSLFDHLKLTAAIGSCMYAYVSQKHPQWLEQSGAKIPWPRNFRNEAAYLLVKADLSGIQSFIYNISSKAALKGLRGRSFYLELMQHQLADELLAILGLSKANLLYIGGGGFAILAPNTEECLRRLEQVGIGFNKWLLDNFKGKLFLALSSSPLSGNQLRGSDEQGSSALSAAWRDVAQKLAVMKQEKFKHHLQEIFRVSASQKECKICHRDDLSVSSLELYPNEELEICPICRDLIELGKNLPDARFKHQQPSLELFYSDDQLSTGLIPCWDEGSKSFLSRSVEISKPKGKEAAGEVLHNFDPYRPPKLYWSLNESSNNEFKGLASYSDGVERIGILRADVDNLGKVFSGTDPNIGLPGRLRSISRDALVSRSLARFFTHYLDDMLLDNGHEERPWAITTVYSGGDDLFLVGAWNQIIEFALLLDDRFKLYTSKALTISAGIAIHKPSYPLYRMAEDAAQAEHVAKMTGKDRLCVRFDESISHDEPHHSFSWNDWKNTIRPLFLNLKELADQADVSKAFWNYLLEYSRSENRSFYKLLYSVARLEERQPYLRDTKLWQDFKMDWVLSLEDLQVRKEKCAYLETAINWLLLNVRESAGRERPARELSISKNK
ncbi:MAG: type III-A CRISPR-associated protein Cas10/Csm1 [Candidatus Obscuribacterales bacterium]|nr:type III-A CRISPR-associated protein Cas10/Csm1 [Candidatus Obscuribacterales bacterium]